MKKLLITLFSIILNICCYAQADNIGDAERLTYINTYKQIAIDEQVRTGIPAAITIAQGIYETAAGKSELATKANNHFGIKCKKEWTGETFLHDDDAPKECFRKYNNALDSYLDHSNYLKNNRRYSFLFDIAVDDYKEWAIGLRKAGYATNPRYAYKLIDLIEKYNLNEYTRQAQIIKENNKINNVIVEEKKVDPKAIEAEQLIKTKAKKEKSTTAEILKQTADNLNLEPEAEMLNELKGFYAKKGDMLLAQAVTRNIKYSKLLVLNDLGEEPLAADMFIYLEKKHKKSPTKRNHIVQENETMHSISQLEGIQLNSLYFLNNMELGEEPAVGAKVSLQTELSKKPALRTAVAEMAEPKIVRQKPQSTETKSKEVDIAGKVMTKQEITTIKENASNPDNVSNVAPEKPIPSYAKDKEPVQATIADNINIKEQQEDFMNELTNNAPKNNTTPTEDANEIAKQKIKETEQALLAEQAAKNKKEAEKAIAEAKRKASEKENVNTVNVVVENAPYATSSNINNTEKVVVLPAPKSPSNYNEAGLNEDIRRMKKVMDEIVYAAPLPPKPKPIVPVVVPTPKPTIAPAGGGKSTLPIKTTTSVKVTNKVEDKKEGAKINTGSNTNKTETNKANTNAKTIAKNAKPIINNKKADKPAANNKKEEKPAAKKSTGTAKPVKPKSK
jgi:hypothetical protein